VHATLIASFGVNLAPFMKDILIQLKDSIDMAYNCNQLREKNTLNPLNGDFDKISHYATGPVSSVAVRAIIILF
jgi:hypothetical protein